MKVAAKRFLLAFCVVLCVATAGWCIDPFKAHHNGFGPKIKGYQLGMKVIPAGFEDGKVSVLYYGAAKEWHFYRKDGVFLGFDIDSEGGRIKEMGFSKSAFGAEAMTDGEFLQEFINAYHIPSMKGESEYSSFFERRISTWRYRNTSEGWGVEYDDLNKMIRVFSIIAESKFN